MSFCKSAIHPDVIVRGGKNLDAAISFLLPLLLWEFYPTIKIKKREQKQKDDTNPTPPVKNNIRTRGNGKKRFKTKD